MNIRPVNSEDQIVHNAILQVRVLNVRKVKSKSELFLPSPTVLWGKQVNTGNMQIFSDSGYVEIDF